MMAVTWPGSSATPAWPTRLPRDLEGFAVDGDLGPLSFDLVGLTFKVQCESLCHLPAPSFY
jgi:hypothetical protein